MNIAKDMELFVRIVQCDSLAAAARELGMTPSSVTMRLNKLEKYYQTKLLSRTTRSISLTESGREFYQDSLQMLDSISQVETKLRSSQEKISGPIRITATSDLGRQHIVPVLDQFMNDYPEIQPFLNLSDSVTDMTESSIDIAIRYGISPDSQLIAKKLATGHRVLCASPGYLQQHGTPMEYSDLQKHQCLTMVQTRTPMTKWFFQTNQGEKSIVIQPSRSCDDGAVVRQWALEGAGIALKAYWDVAADLKAGRLVSVLDDVNPDYQSKKTSVGSDLFIAYQDRKFIPKRTRELISRIQHYFETVVTATHNNRKTSLSKHDRATDNSDSPLVV